jgi:DNA-binding Lrp family transcriptional regulator
MAPDLATSPDLSREDRALVTLIQASFPLVPRPFAALADLFAVGEEALLGRLAALKQSGLLRKLGPVFEPARFGLSSELMAAQVAPDELDRVAAVASAWPPVTHSYARSHPVNLWLAAVAAQADWFETGRTRLVHLPGVSGVWRLPAARRFKVAVRFNLTREADPEIERLTRAIEDINRPSPADLADGVGEDLDRPLLAALETDLPLTSEPFAALADSAGLDAARLLSTLRRWLADGRLRRYGALVSHLRLGFTANAMAVWRVPADRLPEVGASLAASPHVSHCYERPAFPEFPFNLYAMVHARSRERCLELVEDLSDALSASCPDCPREVLFSTQEFRKSSPRFADLLFGPRDPER